MFRFEDIFSQFFQADINQPNASQSTRPPPASRSAISNLPLVKLTADDLLEETNKECVICLCEQTIGSMGCKMPCGHIFHQECVKEWLQKSCSCPVCRFEIATNDASYENIREKKMKERKLRMRLDELRNKSIVQLKELSQSLQVDIRDCLYKKEIVERIAQSGKIIIAEGAPPVELTESEFHLKTVSELKHLLLSFGISLDSALEKSELRHRLLESGRIILIADEIPELEVDPPRPSAQTDVEEQNEMRVSDASSTEEENTPEPSLEQEKSEQSEKAEDVPHMFEDDPFTSSSRSFVPPFSSHSSSSSTCFTSSASWSWSSSVKTPTPSTPTSPLETIALSELQSMSLSALRALCKRLNVSTTGCLEKSEIVERIQLSNKINVVTTTIPSCDSPTKTQQQQEPAEAFSSSRPLSPAHDVEVEEMIRGWPLSRLRQLCKTRGISVQGCIERSEIVDRVLSSGIPRSEFIEKAESVNQDSETTQPSPQNSPDTLILSRGLIMDLSDFEILSIIQANGLAVKSFQDRKDLIDQLEKCVNVQIVD